MASDDRAARMIDLSPAAAEELRMVRADLVEVKIEVLD